MNEDKKLTGEYEVEIDIGKILRACWYRLWIIVLTTVICAACGLFCAKVVIPPKYTSTATIFVNANSLNLGGSSFSVIDYNSGADLVSGYIIILESRETLLEVADYAGVDYSVKELKKMINAQQLKDAFFTVSVTSTSAKEAKNIAEAIGQILPKRINDIISGSETKLVEAPIVPALKSSPSAAKFTVIGGFLGFFTVLCVIAVQCTVDKKIHVESDMNAPSGIPLLCEVPDMTIPSNKKSYSYYREERGDRRVDGTNSLIGDGLNFAAKEAYKLLRTKLEYSFADGKKCHIIGITSPKEGEGKSLSAINLAFAFAQNGKKTLLIGADLRIPTLEKKLGLEKHAGLADYLSGVNSSDISMLRIDCGKGNEAMLLHLLPGGASVPNPIELLGSAKFDNLLVNLSHNYDYIIIDLPPVSGLADALVVGRNTDGLVVVVRAGVCTNKELDSCVAQIKDVKVRVLGFVLNGVGRKDTVYYKKRYGYGYSGYADNAKTSGK